jgi:hypothetical protein
VSDSDKTRTQILGNLAAINTLANQLQDRAIDQATHPLIPGGEAMANLAGCASLEGWANRNDYRERQGIFDDGIEDPEDLWLPIQRLWFWSEAWREEHSQPTDLRPTLHTEAEFLVKIVDWIISHEPRLEDFRADVARTRWQLEDITRDGERPTRSRVRCEDCEGRPRLVKVWAKVARADGWKCPACRRDFTDDEYRRTLRRQVWQPEAARWVTTDEAAYILANMTPPLHKNAAAKLLEHADIQRQTIGRRAMIWLPDVITVHNLERVNREHA